ncbi:MAG: hypothetical protein LUE08_00050 [Akkermansiaceae bacterium]|nr:hypothetical protein [Akkermansiaceae bacterium]
MFHVECKMFHVEQKNADDSAASPRPKTAVDSAARAHDNRRMAGLFETLFGGLYGAKSYQNQGIAARAQGMAQVNALQSQAGAARRQARRIANTEGRNMMAARVNQTRAMSEARAAQGSTGLLSTGTGSHMLNQLREASDRQVDMMARQTSSEMGALYDQAFNAERQARTTQRVTDAQSRYYSQMSSASRSMALWGGISSALGMVAGGLSGYAGASDANARADAYNDAHKAEIEANPELAMRTVNPYRVALGGGINGLFNTVESNTSILSDLLFGWGKNQNPADDNKKDKNKKQD